MYPDLHKTSSGATVCHGVRQYPRVPFCATLILRHLITGGIQRTRGMSLDISEGGLGAIVQGELVVGDAVEIDFSIAGQSLSAVGIVRHASSQQAGFEFVELTAQERSQIATTIGHC
jgi:PilZ domain-containing protein